MDLTGFLNEMLAKTEDDLLSNILKAKGWSRGLLLGQVRSIFDSNGVLMHLEKEYHPETDLRFASDLVDEMDSFGYGLTINTRNILDGTRSLLLAIVPFGEPALSIRKQIPMVDMDRGDLPLESTICRAICALYLVFTLIKGEYIYEHEQRLEHS